MKKVRYWKTDRHGDIS